jgi:hypothetical protein
MKVLDHTPGPWSIKEHSWADTSVYDRDGNYILTLSIEDDATEETQDELEGIMADRARFIAAAPIMMNALKELYEADWLNLPGRAGQIIENAIHKAEGKP